MNFDKNLNWLKLAILLFSVILILIGFLMGYTFNSSACEKNPFRFGINILNDATNSDFTCECRSFDYNIKPISFNKDGVINSISFKK